MEAKARGAKVIHVDPRFTRTSAVADKHVRCGPAPTSRSSARMINYVLANEK
jgi:formate dehydrogenase major subunit